MYACMYLCMYVRILFSFDLQVCMYVRLFVCVYIYNAQILKEIVLHPSLQFVSVYVLRLLHSFICMYVHVYVCMCVCAYMCVCVCVCIYIYIYIYIHTHTHVHRLNMSFTFILAERRSLSISEDLPQNSRQISAPGVVCYELNGVYYIYIYIYIYTYIHKYTHCLQCTNGS